MKRLPITKKERDYLKSVVDRAFTNNINRNTDAFSQAIRLHDFTKATTLLISKPILPEISDTLMVLIHNEFRASKKSSWVLLSKKFLA